MSAIALRTLLNAPFWSKDVAVWGGSPQALDDLLSGCLRLDLDVLDLLPEDENLPSASEDRAELLCQELQKYLLSKRPDNGSRVVLVVHNPSILVRYGVGLQADNADVNFVDFWGGKARHVESLHAGRVGNLRRYFRKLDNRWFLRDEAVGTTNDKNGGDLFSASDVEVAINDETTAIAWLTQRLGQTPMRIGELRPHWMRATVKLTTDISTRLDQYLLEHFWFDRKTHRWRIPTDEELSQMDDTERRRARFDAERYLVGTHRRHPTDSEVLNWIEHLYHSAVRMEEESLGLVENGQDAELPEEAATLYAMMPRLLQGVLKENVEPRTYSLAQRHCRIAAAKLTEKTERDAAERKAAKLRKERLPLFDGLDTNE